MATDVAASSFTAVLSALKPVLSKYSKDLSVVVDTEAEYTLHTKSPSPFPQHKGQPLFFASVRVGKAYVSLHLLPLYMDPVLSAMVSPALKKRMQGKACFNFKKEPDAELVADLEQLTEAAFRRWSEKNWI